MTARRSCTLPASRFLWHRAALAASAALLLSLVSEPDAAFADSPNGSQFQVNTYTTNNQFLPRVASDASGDFVVVWESYGSAGSDTAGFSVQGQRYNANGSLSSGQFQVNTYTTGNQTYPSVASDSSGNFLVVWQSNGSAGSDTSGFSVQGQRYNASGSLNGGQFQVNTYTTGDQTSPSVASDSLGNVVVVWQNAGLSVQGQRYNASGSALGGEFQVNTYTTNNQQFPSIASDSAGNFVVVWQSQGSPGTDTSGLSVQGQRYNASGSALSGEFQVNTYTTNSQSRPSVASNSAGDFVVVWESLGSAGSDTSGLSVQGQRYNASGGALGGQFQVNTYTTSNQYRPSVAGDSAGDFIVAWESYGSAGSDTDRVAILGQIYDVHNGSAAALGGEFQINTYTTNDQFAPSVASDSTGNNFVVLWESYGSAGTDSSGSSVQGQRYLPEPSFGHSIGAALAMAVILARRRQQALR